MKYQYELIVIGSGSSGFSAAAAARANGTKKILLVEKRKLGYSLCTNEGCMPSKTLIASAQVKSVVERSMEYGIRSGAVRADWSRVQKRARNLVDNDFVAFRRLMIQHSKIKTVKGAAMFVSPHEIQVGSTRYSAEKFIIATGSEPVVPPIKGLEETGYLDSSRALFLKKLPKSLIVIGGGYIAVELGYLFHEMGVRVTVLERGDHLLKRLDTDVGRELTRLLRESGMNVVTNMSVNWVKKSGAKKIVCADTKAHGKEHCFSAQEILVATGRKPATEGLNIEAAHLKTDKRGVIGTNLELATSQKHIWAVGDANGKAPLVYTASMEGRIAGHNASHKKKKRMQYGLVGNIIFSHPEIGTIGLTEEEAREAGHDIAAHTTPMADIGKAVAIGETDGFVKMVADKKTGRILGLHILGAHATDIMQTALPHFYHRDTVFDVMNIPYPHPTLGEALAYPAEELANRLR